jgi:hypothetical protein
MHIIYYNYLTFTLYAKFAGFVPYNPQATLTLLEVEEIGLFGFWLKNEVFWGFC